jgi:hypothetical protein
MHGSECFSPDFLILDLSNSDFRQISARPIQSYFEALLRRAIMILGNILQASTFPTKTSNDRDPSNDYIIITVENRTTVVLLNPIHVTQSDPPVTKWLRVSEFRKPACLHAVLCKSDISLLSRQFDCC